MVVKRVAERAKLNCKQCVTSTATNAPKDALHEFFLHKFRTPSQTTCRRRRHPYRAGWLGHRDIKSTMLPQGIRSKDAAQKVNSGELAALVHRRLKGINDQGLLKGAFSIPPR